MSKATATIYLRVPNEVKDFFTAQAKNVDRPLNYHIVSVLEKAMKQKPARRKDAKSKDHNNAE